MSDATQLIAVPALPAIESISAIEAARAQRDELLTKARKGTSIANPDAAAKCAAFLKQLAEFSRTIEATRKAVKDPVILVGKRIDAVAAELTTDIDAEYERIRAMLGAFQAEQKRREEEARRKAWEEQERIRLEAERKEREAREKAEAAERERQRIAREEQEARDKAARAEQERLERLAAQARTETARVKRQDELEAAQARAAQEKKEADERAERERIEREQRERDEQAKRAQEAAAAQAKAATAVVPTAPAIQGVSSRGDVEFEVTDIVQLYEAQPAFVILTPNKAALKAALKQLPEGQSLPGVRHWKTVKAVVR